MSDILIPSADGRLQSHPTEMQIPIIPIALKKLRDNAAAPTKGSQFSAGWDLYAAEGAEIAPHTTKLIPTGWAIQLPPGTFGGIYARSGLATKQGLRPANCVGVVDSDYRGEVMVALHNDTDETKVVAGNDRIAQLIIQPYYFTALIDIGDKELDGSDRGDGGFGSTGK